MPPSETFIRKGIITQSNPIPLTRSVSISPAVIYVLVQKIKRYLRIGFLLHLMTIAGIAMAFYFFILAQHIGFESIRIETLFYLYLSAYGASLPLFAQLDARSRYQNYKLMKDKLYRYGFSKRIVEPLSWSRCQRDAIQVAADDLGYSKEMKSLFKSLGFKWFHIIPRILIRNPRLILTKAYWNKTLFVKHYTLKNFPY